MLKVNENINRNIGKFTSECIVVGKHGVIDLDNEHAVIDAYRALQKFLADELRITSAMEFTPSEMEHAQRGRAKAIKELKELKPYIRPEVLARLDAEFREMGNQPKNLSERRSLNMDNKLDEGFDEVYDEMLSLAGIYDDSCDETEEDEADPMDDCLAVVSCEVEEEPELSDDMGKELKDNDEDELDESIRDFLPKAGAFRNDDGKMIGGFIGNGSKDRIEKAKKIAKAKFYNGDRMGRVSDEEIDNFDEVYADLMHRAGRDPELDETSQPKSYLKPLNETTAGDGSFSDKELAQLGAITRKPTKKFKIYQSPMGEIVVTDHVLDKSWALMDEADTFDEIEDKILSDWEDANAVGYDKHILNYPEVASLPQFEDPMHDDEYFWDVSEYYEPITEATEVETAGIDDFEVNTPEENPIDEIRMDVPLFMRCLEFAREDAQDDADLHHLVEKAVELSKDGKTLTMDNYDELAGGVSEGVVDEAKDPNVDAEMKSIKNNGFKKGCPVKRKWKRIEKKTPIEEARHALPYKLVIKQFNQLCDVNRMARDGDELAMDFMKNRGKIYDSKAEARAALKQKYGKAKFANWIVIEEDTGF